MRHAASEGTLIICLIFSVYVGNVLFLLSLPCILRRSFRDHLHVIAGFILWALSSRLRVYVVPQSARAIMELTPVKAVSVNASRDRSASRFAEDGIDADVSAALFCSRS